MLTTEEKIKLIEDLDYVFGTLPFEEIERLNEEFLFLFPQYSPSGEMTDEEWLWWKSKLLPEDKFDYNKAYERAMSIL